MFHKFKTILCHPSFFGMYLMDKWYQVIGWIFGFFLFTVLVLAGKDMHTPAISSEGTDTLAEEILSVSELSDTVYENGILSGTMKKISVSSGTVYMNLESYTPQGTTALVFVFMSEGAEVYYSKNKIGEITYKDLSITDFSFESIKSGSAMDKIQFNYLVTSLVSSAEKNYRSIAFFQDFLILLLFYAIAFIITYFTAYLTNPEIERKIRLKLAGYDSIVYFTVMIFGILFSISWFAYVACGMGIVYAGCTFMHIKKITVRKGGPKNDYPGKN